MQSLLRALASPRVVHRGLLAPKISSPAISSIFRSQFRGISHVHVKCQGKLLVVKSESLEESLLQKAVNSPPFADWLGRMDSLKEKMRLKRVEVQAVDLFRTQVGFIKFVAEVEDAEGDPCPGAVFMRGGSVAVLVRDLPSFFHSFLLLFHSFFSFIRSSFIRSILSLLVFFFVQSLCIIWELTLSFPPSITFQS